MGCYCGCATKASKGRWAAVVVAAVICVILWIIYGVEVNKCELCDSEGRCRDADSGVRFYDETIENCSVGLVVFGFYGAIIAFIASTIPCCMMCCCSEGPHKPHQPVSVVAVPVAAPHQPQWQAANPAAHPAAPLPAAAPPGPYAYGQPVPVGTAGAPPPPPAVGHKAV